MWISTKSGKKKFLEFQKAKDPKGVIYYGLAVKVPAELRMTQSFNDLLIEAIKLKGGLKNRAILLKDVTVTYSGKQWLKPSATTEVIVLDNNPAIREVKDKIVFRKKVEGTDDWDTVMGRNKPGAENQDGIEDEGEFLTEGEDWLNASPKPEGAAKRFASEKKLPFDGTESISTHGLPTLEEALKEAMQDAAGSLMGNGVEGEGVDPDDRGLFEAEPIPDEKALFEMEMQSQFISEEEDDVQDVESQEDMHDDGELWDNGEYEDIKGLAATDGIDVYQYCPKEVRMGMEVEMEHGTEAGDYDVTFDDPLMTLKIALTHLDEHPHYYTLLFESGIEDEPSEIDECSMGAPSANDYASMKEVTDFSEWDKRWEESLMDLKKAKALNEGFRIIDGNLYDGAGQQIGDKNGIIPHDKRKPYDSNNINEEDAVLPGAEDFATQDQDIAGDEEEIVTDTKDPRFQKFIKYMWEWLAEHALEFDIPDEDLRDWTDQDIKRNFLKYKAMECDSKSTSDSIIGEAMGKLPDGSGFMTGTIKEDTFDTNGLCGTTPGMSRTQGNFNEINK